MGCPVNTNHIFAMDPSESLGDKHIIVCNHEKEIIGADVNRNKNLLDFIFFSATE